MKLKLLKRWCIWYIGVFGVAYYFISDYISLEVSIIINIISDFNSVCIYHKNQSNKTILKVLTIL